MCGIYSSIGFPPDQTRIDIVSYRGPDGRGWREFSSPAGTVALGHRRLAIIDLSNNGLQPMADSSGRFHLIFNGELYNYLELRQQLAQRGEIFCTETDSEVLLRAYQAWGEQALARFRGMFAFVIWDDMEKRLFAARDRFGIKPLYLVANNAGVALASEIKQLLGLPGLTGRMNLPRARDFLAGGIADHTAETLFENVMQLRGGECLSVHAGTSGRLCVRRRRWYSPTDPRQRLMLSETHAAEQFRDRLNDAVRIHLRSDVPVGSCLSGGLDSSSLVCLMAQMMASQNSAHRVETVSACYPGETVDERQFMDATIERAHTIPHFVYPRAEDVFTRASDITWHQDEPFGSTSIFAQWCVFEEAERAGLKVMLDGQGADEQLAGYHSSFAFHLMGLFRSGRLIEFARVLRERARLHDVSAGEQILRMAAPLLSGRFLGPLRRSRRAVMDHGWLAPQEGADFSSTIEAQLKELGLLQATDVATHCYALTFVSNLQLLLHWEDRNSMAHSVEARVPFLDHPLMEFSLMLGNEHKFSGAETKRVLRLAMHDVVPEKVRLRTDKIGFATPEQSWFRTRLKGAIRDGVEATLVRFPGLFNASGTRQYAAEMLDGSRSVDFALWRIVNLGLWGDRFSVSY
jgi:asparagine synthase (glutamine-hydrolysing)